MRPGQELKCLTWEDGIKEKKNPYFFKDTMDITELLHKSKALNCVSHSMFVTDFSE